MRVETTLEYDEWLLAIREKERRQIDDRLDRIRQHSHFGDRRYLGGDLFELRWLNGRRIYYAIVMKADGGIVLLLLGGSKNGQERDIRHARTILAREAS